MEHPQDCQIFFQAFGSLHGQDNGQFFFLLPRVELERPPKAIGTNTTHSIQSGLIFGYAGLVEGMVARFREELGPDMKVIATGAFANLIARETKAIQIVDPWLTLKGLRIIYELNRK